MITIVLVVFSLSGILYILSPIFLNKAEKNIAVIGEEQKMASLNEHKKILFTSLKELEFEYETGKISQKDYETLRDEHKTKVIIIYKELDELDKSVRNVIV